MVAIRNLAESGTTVIEPGPRLSGDNAREFLQAVLGLPPVMSPTVVVNMQQTTLVDSTGIGVLVQAMKHVQKVNGTFALTGLREEILRSFHLMNLHQVFSIYATEALAHKHLRSRGQ